MLATVSLLPVTPEVLSLVSLISLIPGKRLLRYSASMAMDSHTRLSELGSTTTLDLKDVLPSPAEEVLLSTRLSFASDSDCSHSFDDTPPFPLTIKPLFAISDYGTSLLPSHFPAASPTNDVSLITAPTGPRLKLLLMEKISVHAWNVCG